ncbi:MAG: glutamate racemase [Hyphomicrobiales bacterium]
MTPSMQSPKLLVVDSGVGGLSVARAIRKELPELSMIYAADYAAFPYGDWEAEALRDHLFKQISKWIEEQSPDCVVIACNTASTLILPSLRATFDLPFVGTVPAIKPAAATSRTGMISVLATPGTVKRDYTRALMQEFAKGLSVELVGSQHLAALAEHWFVSGPSEELRQKIQDELSPCFIESQSGNKTDCVVLGCTHFPLLVDVLPILAPWPVKWVDPSPAIARRVGEVLGKKAKKCSGGTFEIISSTESRTEHVESLWVKLLLP